MSLDIKLFGYYPGANCTSCSNFEGCGGKAHLWDFQSMKPKLIERYGDRVRVSLIDVFTDEVEKFPAIVEHIKSCGLRIPILMLEGEIIACGGEASDNAVFEIVDYALAEQAKETAAAGQ
jgi:disulfide oxidoreductase YuzD